MESFRRFFLLSFVVVAGLTNSRSVLGAFPSKMNGAQNDASDITWSHAVNSWDALEKALAGPIDFLEADISLGHVIGHGQGPSVPIMAHPPDVTSDISLDTWLSTVQKKGPSKGIKLDFKSLSVVEPSLIILEKYASKLKSSMWLNADVLSGPVQSRRTPVQVEPFLALCHQYFPNATLSIGWTTSLHPTITEELWHYGWNHIREMVDVIRCSGRENVIPAITFPVRAIFTSRSIKQLQWLLSIVPNSTLTVWSDKYDPLQLQDLLQIRSSFPKHRVYYDVPDKISSLFKEKKNTVSIPDTDLVYKDAQWMTVTHGLDETCSTSTYVRNNGILFGRSVTTAVFRKNVILGSHNDLKVTGKIQFFKTESSQASPSAGRMHELDLVLVDVSLFSRNMSDGSGKEFDLTLSDSDVVWSALNSSVAYTFQHKYDEENTSCQIFKLDTSQDKSFQVWTVPCDVMFEESDLEQISKTGIPVISPRKRLVPPQGPFLLGFVADGDKYTVVYDLNIGDSKDRSTSAVEPTSTNMFSMVFLLVTVFLLFIV